MLQMHCRSAAWVLAGVKCHTYIIATAASILLPGVADTFKAAHISFLCASPLFLPSTFYAVFAGFSLKLINKHVKQDATQGTRTGYKRDQGWHADDNCAA